jgi:hypothetical protein
MSLQTLNISGREAERPGFWERRFGTGHIKREFDRIQSGNAEEIGAAASRLRYVWPLVDADPLARAYYRGSEAERRSDRMRALAAAYEELIGKDIGEGNRADLD